MMVSFYDDVTLREKGTTKPDRPTYRAAKAPIAI